MRLERLCVRKEHTDAQAARGILYLTDFRDAEEMLRQEYSGKVQMCYFDPPYATGQTFSCRRKVGEDDWKRGRGSLELMAYEDPADESAYIYMMRQALTLARDLLCDKGVLFLHVDWRMSAHMRILMDELFGRENFLNEIVWAYQTGGRAKRFFSRKHDTILLYSKTSRYYLDVFNVAERRANARSNHMKRQIDADGRAYRSIRSGGKTYIYYDDDPVCPGDVWDDVSHLQQKDPQRTGYDTQKPMRLLERIIRCSTKPGDIVCDLFAGSGTTLAAAANLGRKFVGTDRSPLAFHTARRRLLRYPVSFDAPEDPDTLQAEAEVTTAIANHEVRLQYFGPEKEGITYPDLVESWSAGYLRDGAFMSLAHAQRSRRAPALKEMLEIPVLKGDICIQITDVFGRSAHFILPREDRI